MGNTNVKDQDDIPIIIPNEELDIEKIEEFKKVNTLIFQGGSVKGLSYVGSLSTLDNYFKDMKEGKTFLSQIETVAGTSAGSITALLIACGLEIYEINSIMKTTSFSSFADAPFWTSFYVGKFVEIFSRGYLCEGNTFIDWIKGILKNHVNVDENITFKQLKEAKGKSLLVYAVRLNDNKLVQFSPQTTPNVPVWLAVRMSMSIPIFFKPVRVNQTGEGLDTHIELDEANGKTYYVDGGMIANYPWSQVLEGMKIDHTNVLGFKILSQSELDTLHKVIVEKKWPEINVGFSRNLIPYSFGPLFAIQDNIFYSDSKEGTEMRNRTIKVFDENVSFLNFNMSRKVKESLISSGIKSVFNFFHKHQFSHHQKLHFDKEYTSKEINFKSSCFGKEVERLKEVVNCIKEHDDVEHSPTESIVNLQKDLRKLKSYMSMTIDNMPKEPEHIQKYLNYQQEVISMISDLDLVLKKMGYKHEEPRYNVTISSIEAKNLPNKDNGKDLSDPYCIFTLDGTTKRTLYINNNVNPVWKETLSFTNIKSSATLSIKIYDSDYLSDDLLGKFEIDLNILETGQLLTNKLTESGENSTVSFKIEKQNN